jgi:hypothetical protein
MGLKSELGKRQAGNGKIDSKLKGLGGIIRRNSF